MLDIKLIRENPEILRGSQKKRGESTQVVDLILGKDKSWREAMQKLEQMRSTRNKVALEINELKKQKKSATDKIKKMKELSAKISKAELKAQELRSDRNELLMSTPNILDESVPAGEGPEGNVELKKVGKPKKYNFPLKSHVDLLEGLDGADLERASKVAGSRFYYLKNDLVFLDLALRKFTLDLLAKKGYTIFDPVYMLNRKAMESVVDLNDFEAMLYKIEGEDLYLIATSEHSLGAFHMDEILLEKDLPLRYAGISPCFRKEAGSHGKDTKGIFRVHKFHKVEQFVFSQPEESQKIHEELLANAEEIFKKLEIPYRVTAICTGDIGTIAAKKYDLEAWMPAQGIYREVTSCSNCTDYQARRLNTRYWKAPGEDTKFPHTLNSTAIATSRAIVAILENNQQADGSVLIPKVLQPYMNGQKKMKPK